MYVVCHIDSLILPECLPKQAKYAKKRQNRQNRQTSPNRPKQAGTDTYLINNLYIQAVSLSPICLRCLSVGRKVRIHKLSLPPTLKSFTYLINNLYIQAVSLSP